MVLFSFPPKKFFFCRCSLSGWTIEILLSEMVKNTFDQMDREPKFERIQLIFSIVLFGKCTRWPCLLFFAHAFTVRGRRYGGQTGEKLPFPLFCGKEEEERVKTERGSWGWGREQKIRIERSGSV